MPHPPKPGPVIFKCLISPFFATLAWLLWREGHTFWAGLVSLQIALAIHSVVRHIQRLRRTDQE